MTFKEAKKEFERSFVIDKNDKPATGELWCLFIDSLHRDSLISDSQAETWGNPYYE